MNDPWMRSLLSSIAGMIPAVFGGMLFARLVASHDERLYPSAFVLGIVCAVVVMAVSRGRGWDIVLAAVFVSLVGLTLGLLFDAKWNSVGRVAVQLMEKHEGLTEAQATMQANTILGGMSYVDLVRARLHVDNLLIPLFAVLGAGLTVRSRLFGRVLRITDEPKCDAMSEPM
jgi:hypothetical protein